MNITRSLFVLLLISFAMIPILSFAAPIEGEPLTTPESCADCPTKTIKLASVLCSPSLPTYDACAKQAKEDLAATASPYQPWPDDRTDSTWLKNVFLLCLSKYVNRECSTGGVKGDCLPDVDYSRVSILNDTYNGDVEFYLQLNCSFKCLARPKK